MVKRKSSSGTIRSGSNGKWNQKSRSSKAQLFPAKCTSTASTNPDRVLPDSKKAGFYRDKAKIGLLNMYNNKPNREKVRLNYNRPPCLTILVTYLSRCSLPIEYLVYL